MAIINIVLPAEMLERVFRLLPPKDLKNVLLVCSWWMEVGQDPSLWPWATLVVRWGSLAIMPTLLDTRRRLQAVKRLDVWVVSEELLQAILRHSGLKKVVFKCRISPLPPQIVASMVAQTEEVRLVSCGLTPQQASAICSTITPTSSLRRLDLEDNVLGSVEANQLARAVGHLEELNLSWCSLTPEQANAVIQSLHKSSKLRKLWIGGNRLCIVEPTMLARTVAGLHTAAMVDSSLTLPQLTALCSMEMRNLSTLDLSRNFLNLVDPMLLAGAMVEVEKVYLKRTNVTFRQVEAIFAATQRSSKKLRKLKLAGNDLSAVNAEVMAQGVNCLAEVDLDDTSLRGDQVTRILEQAVVTTCLHTLTLSRVGEKVSKAMLHQAGQTIPNLSPCSHS